MNGLIVDNFAGGGGASEGIRNALGRSVDIAINHSAKAIAMHQANNPDTLHLIEDVFSVDIQKVCGERPVDLLWLSPDCTHHSKARGGKPRDKKLRGLAWIAVKWAKAKLPTVICLENVTEFLSWGPLDDEGNPIKSLKKETFNEWKFSLEKLGYVVEHRIINAKDFGAPTSRERLFVIARCDGNPIIWPRPTHGNSDDLFNRHLSRTEQHRKL